MRGRDILALILITAAAALLRLYGLDAQSVWYDESFSVAHSARPWHDLLPILIQDFVHPPLHYLALQAWYSVAGFGAWQARLLSAILGTLCIPALFVLTRKLSDARTGLCAALLLALSQMGVYFSQEARPYVQVQLLSLLTAIAFLSFLEKPDWKRGAALFAGGTSLLYTHYYGAATLLALALFWVWLRRPLSRQVCGRLIAIALAMAACLAFWIVTVAPGIQARRSGAAHRRHASNRVSIAAPLQALNRLNNAKFISMEAETTTAQAAAAALVFTVPAVLALFYRRRHGWEAAALGWLLVVCPVALAILGAALGMVINYRHFSFAVAGYSMAVAVGWRNCLGGGRLRWGWLALAVALSGLALRANYMAPTKPDYRAGFLPLASHYQPGDCVAGRPFAWREHVHYAWEIYHRDKPLRFVRFRDLPAVPDSCGRLWLLWDKTWWMNVDPDVERRSAPALDEVRKQFEERRHFPHPAIELELLQGRKAAASRAAGAGHRAFAPPNGRPGSLTP